LLRVEDLTTGYGDIEVVRDVTVTVTSGSLVAIVGSNGAGKTTLLSALCGVLPHKGSVWLGDRDLSHASVHDRARAGLLMVPEGRRLFTGLTVRENLVAGSTFTPARATRGRQLDRVFQLFPVLKERSAQLCQTLSGGEQQMLAIARTLMGGPKVLVLDEPSLGLAPRMVEEVFRVIGQLREAGDTILLVEQNIRRSLAFADYAYVLDHGRVVLAGSGSELLDDERVRQAYLGTGRASSRDAV
jgi:branched-chain amino acid transport system ATP-binding protein